MCLYRWGWDTPYHEVGFGQLKGAEMLQYVSVYKERLVIVRSVKYQLNKSHVMGYIPSNFWLFADIIGSHLKEFNLFWKSFQSVS